LGTGVDVTGRADDWYRVALADGRTGFVWKSLLGEQAPAAEPRATELALWNAIKDSGDPAMFREYLKQFPGGTFAGVARLKIEKLGKRQAAFTAPPKPVTPPPAKPAVGIYPKAFKPGEVFRHCEGCPEMVVILSGRFMMGSPGSEAGRGQDEGPQHLVSVRSFALGKYEVTFSQWDACVAGGGYNGYRPRGSWGRGTQPVTNVSWEDARAYVAWLSKKTGQRYRLASEWEYAARARRKTARYWGEAIGYGNANCNGCGSQWDGRQTVDANKSPKPRR
jgi:formylglycine-generating enzyme required for sulfatase activity